MSDMDTTFRSIAERASEQLGLITREQLRQLHISRARRRHYVATGVLVPVGANVFGLAGRPTSFEPGVLAACLDPGGIASRRTAAAFHRLHGFACRPADLEVTVIDGHCNARSSLARVHTTTWLPE